MIHEAAIKMNGAANILIGLAGFLASTIAAGASGCAPDAADLSARSRGAGVFRAVGHRMPHASVCER